MHIKLHRCLTQTGTGIVYPVGPSVPGCMYLPKKKKAAMVNTKIKLVFPQKFKM